MDDCHEIQFKIILCLIWQFYQFDMEKLEQKSKMSNFKTHKTKQENPVFCFCLVWLICPFICDLNCSKNLISVTERHVVLYRSVITRSPGAVVMWENIFSHLWINTEGNKIRNIWDVICIKQYFHMSDNNSIKIASHFGLFYPQIVINYSSHSHQNVSLPVLIKQE